MLTQFNLHFSPLLPGATLAGLAMLALAVLALSLWRRRPGVLLRALAFALALAALANPSLVQEKRTPLKDVVAVILDRSASQSLGERTAQTNAARALIKKRLAALRGVETRFVDADARDPRNLGTRLFSALNGALADVPPDRVGGAIMVTDGEVDDIPKSVGALGFKAPLHVFVTGHKGEEDRRIQLVEAPRFGIVGKVLTISARVFDTSKQAGPMSVIVRRDGQEVARLSARPGEVIRARVRIEHGGPNVIELETPALPHELTAINNKAVITVQGVRDKLKVLLVSGEPNPGERTWRNLLKSDPNVDLVHFTILRPPDKQDATPINELSLIAFPTADLFGRKIKDFDLIIFDRYSDQTILPSMYLENIVRYVRGGGALLMGAGPDFATKDGLYYSPLRRVMPVRPDGKVVERAFWPTVSAQGLKDPVTRNLPGAASSPPRWSVWFRQIEAAATRGTPVLNGVDGSPLLVLSHEGKGRVAVLLSDQIWLWARGYQGGGPYIDLLRRTAHWLMKQPALDEEALRARSRGGEIFIERQSLKEKVGPVVLTAPSGKRRTITLAGAKPGLWRAHVKAAELGLYRLREGALSALVNVGPENPREFQDVVSTTKKLAPIAQASGGTVRRIAAGKGGAVKIPRFVAMREGPVFGGSDYVGIKRTGASTITGVDVTPLAVGFLGLLALLGSAIAAWVKEGRGL